MAVLALILAIIGILVFGIPCGIAAVILGAISSVRDERKGAGIVSIVLGIIDIIGAAVGIALVNLF